MAKLLRWLSAWALTVACLVRQHASVRVRHMSADLTSSDEHAGRLPPIVAINEDTPQVIRLRITKDPLFRKRWPTHCPGTNYYKEPLPLNTDGFACFKDPLDIQPIISVMWKEPEAACCKSECIPIGAFKSVRYNCGLPLTLAQAAGRAALAVTEMVTESGNHVDVLSKIHSVEDFAKDGLRAEFIIRMEGDDLGFYGYSTKLYPKGEQFLKEVQSPMASLLTLQLTAFHEGTHILFCPHGSANATRSGIRRGFEDLPMQRAAVVGDRLKELLDGFEQAKLGDAFGHFTHETDSFLGGRYGAILYKLYDASIEEQSCQHSDLHAFFNTDGTRRLPARMKVGPHEALHLATDATLPALSEEDKPSDPPSDASSDHLVEVLDDERIPAPTKEPTSKRNVTRRPTRRSTRRPTSRPTRGPTPQADAQAAGQRAGRLRHPMADPDF